VEATVEDVAEDATKTTSADGIATKRAEAVADWMRTDTVRTA